ncbi:MAG: thiamine diphosphokinase [Eubacterium sp.]|nr:thiamine diphosphokinase [Eubacterium sp.]
MKLILVAGGNVETGWLTEQLKRQYARGAVKLLGVDAGVLQIEQTGYIPDQVIGDFDSVSESDRLRILDRYKEKRVLNPVKDDTDMEAALHLAVAMRPEEILILGGIGSRMDHTMTNIRLLAIPDQAGIPAVILDPHNRIRRIESGTMIRKEEQYGKYISLMAVSEEVRGLTLKGFKYSLTDGTLPAETSLGISNEIIDDQGMISFTGGRVLLLETKD